MSTSPSQGDPAVGPVHPSSGGWRLEARARIAELRQALQPSPTPPPAEAQFLAALSEAEHTVAASEGGQHTVRRWWSGIDVETAWQAIHRASAGLPLVVPAAELPAQLLHAQKRAAEQLPPRDPRRIAVNAREL